MTATLSVQEIIHKHAAVLDSDGRRVAEALQAAAQKQQAVSLSFKGLRHITTAFLHAAIGTVLLQQPSFASLLSIIDTEEVPHTVSKIDEVKSMALDPVYRQQVNQAMDAELA